MAIGFRPNLGVGLQNIVAGDEWPLSKMPSPLPGGGPGTGQMPGQTTGQAPAPQPEGMSRAAMLMGLLGDAIAANTGGQAIIAPMLLRQREQAAHDQREDVNWGRRRAAEREDKQWEWQNKPHEPDQFERYLGAIGVKPGSPEYAQKMSQRVENMVNPMMPVATTDANGNPAYTYLPRNGGQTGGTAATGTPTVSDEASYNALPPGTKYMDPSGHLRTKGGGAGNGVGGFHP